MNVIPDFPCMNRSTSQKKKHKQKQNKTNKLLHKYDFEHVMTEQNVQRESEFLREMKQRLVSEYSSVLSDDLTNSTRYDFYRSFKSTWHRESYLYSIDKKIVWDAFIRFRTGFSDLFVHKYRFANLSSGNVRIFPACYEENECEKHVLLECPTYEDLRHK